MKMEALFAEKMAEFFIFAFLWDNIDPTNALQASKYALKHRRSPVQTWMKTTGKSVFMV